MWGASSKPCFDAGLEDHQTHHGLGIDAPHPRPSQLYDIKISIKGSNYTIAKTQIPWWDIPTTPAPSTAAAAAPEEQMAPDLASSGAAQAQQETGPGGKEGEGPAGASGSSGGGACAEGSGPGSQQQPHITATGPTGAEASQAAVAAVVAAAAPASAVRPAGALSCSTTGQGLAGFSLDALSGSGSGSLLVSADGQAGADGTKALWSKRLALDVSDLASPRVAPGGVSFSIPAHRPGDGGDADDGGDAAAAAAAATAAAAGALLSPRELFAARGKGDVAAKLALETGSASTVGLDAGVKGTSPAGSILTAQTSGGSGGSARCDSEADVSGISSGSEGGSTKRAPAAAANDPCASPAAAVLPAAAPAHTATVPASPASSFTSPRRRGSVLSYAPGSAYELSRRLRSMLAPAAREVSRMGWAPVRGAGRRGAAEGDAGGNCEAGAAPAGGLVADVWGAWKVGQPQAGFIGRSIHVGTRSEIASVYCDNGPAAAAC
jgi:hypothetical protein